MLENQKTIYTEECNKAFWNHMKLCNQFTITQLPYETTIPLTGSHYMPIESIKKLKNKIHQYSPQREICTVYSLIEHPSSLFFTYSKTVTKWLTDSGFLLMILIFNLSQKKESV